MRLDVVGVAVPTERVVRDDDLGAGLADHADQLGRSLDQVGPPEHVRPVVRGRTHHPRVAPAPGAAEEAVVGHPELDHRGRELDLAVRPELVVGSGGELGEGGDEHLALLAAGAGDERDGGTLGGVPGHGHAGADRLVVRVGVDEQEAAGRQR